MKTALLLILSACTLYSQPLNFRTNEISGVRLTISMTNDVWKIGNPAIVHCSLKNSSTNALSIMITGHLDEEFSEISLTNKAGKFYDLRPHPKIRVYFGNVSIIVPAGQTHESKIKIVPGKEIEAGSYKLQVKRRFSVRANTGKTNAMHEVASQPVEIRLQ